MFMQPSIEQRQMGAGLQNMSRSWAVTGGDISPFGQGLSRGASQKLAGGIQDMADDPGFKEQTGGMFNRQDLMNITKQGGQQGLFDMAQEVPQIQQKLRQTANTIKQFMELTNDPDITNVIRQMGQMQQLGMTQQDMTKAAQGMKTYSRAAGTSIGGLQDIGGMPGAATFQQAGLSAGQGFQYGNFAAASARQTVASGAVSPRQLSLMGGVQGMAQRDMQAQAAFSSMPLNAAANAQFGAGGWGVNQGGVGQETGGAFGIVNRANQAMSSAVQEGGLGALAAFPLKQREIADSVQSQMTPQTAMAQRFSTAMSTGQQLGLSGQGAFAAGARTLYGDDVASQMMTQASSPGFWKAQKQVLRGPQRELGARTMRRAEAASPMWGGIPKGIGRGLGLTGRGSWGRGVGQFVGGIGEGISELGGAIARPFERYGVGRKNAGGLFDDGARGQGLHYTDMSDEDTAATLGAAGASEEAIMEGLGGTGTRVEDFQVTGGMHKAIEMSDASEWGVAFQRQSDSLLGSGMGMGAAGLFSGLDLGMTKSLDSMIGGRGLTPKQQKARASKAVSNLATSMEMIDRAKAEGGKDTLVVEAMDSIEQAVGEGTSMSVLEVAGRGIDGLMQKRGSDGKPLTKADYKAELKKSIMEVGGKSSKEADAAIAKMEKSGAIKQVYNQAIHYAKKGSEDPDVWVEFEQESKENISEQIREAGEQRSDAIRDSIETAEGNLDLDSFLGDYSDQENKIQGIAAASGGKGFSLRVAAARAFTGDEDDRDNTLWQKLEKEARERGMSSKDILALRKEVEAYDPETASRMADLSEQGTVEDREKYARGQHAIGQQGIFTSEGFQQSVGKYSEKLEGYLATEEGEITAEGIAKQFTDEELKNMAREGGMGGRQMASLFGKAKKGDKKAQALISKFAKEQEEISAEGEQEKQTVKGEGKEAQEVEEGIESMDNMAKLFSDFKPAAKDFKYGATALRDAMDDLMIQKHED
jgi:hypothetical protein